jgi:hypothetical protein
MMFRSFFFAGFEGTTGYNRDRQWIDQIAATQHDQQADADYRRLREAGLFAARECVRWPLVDQGCRYDFRSVEAFVNASVHHQIDVIWDLFHYGYPKDLDPFSDAFVERFAAYCAACAQFLDKRTPGPLYLTPVNEPSFLAWAAGDAGRFAPHRRDCARDLKIALIRAALAGIKAIRATVPRACIINVDPLCHVVPAVDRPDLVAEAADFNFNAVFEGWDMLCGRLYPELGGSREHLGVIGINYYWTNQWEMGREEYPISAGDPRRVPLSTLLCRVHERYGGEILITETSHVGAERPEWLRCIANEAQIAIDAGVPLRGVCLYPVLGMPEWHDPGVWVSMGLWDLERKSDGHLERVPYLPAFEALREAQHHTRQPRAPAHRSRRQPEPLPSNE